MNRFIGIILAALTIAACAEKAENVDLSLVPVSVNGTFRYIGIPGGELMGGQYRDASYFRDGLAVVVQEDGTMVVIDKDFNPVEGEVVLPGIMAPKHDSKPRAAKDPSRHLYGYKGMAGKWAIAPTYKFAEPFYDGLAVVRANVRFQTKCGLIRKSEAFAIPPIYDEMYRIGPRTYIVRMGGECGIVFADGTPLLPLNRTYRFTVPEDDARLIGQAAKASQAQTR